MDNVEKWLHSEDWPRIKKYLSTFEDENYDSSAYFSKGFMLAYGPKSERNITLAISLFEKACTIEPKNSRYLNTYSEILLQTKQATKGLEVALKSTELFPYNAMSAIALGRAGWESKNRDIAYNSYKKALYLLPGNLPGIRDQVSQMVFKLSPFWWEALKGRNIKLVRKGKEHADFLIRCRRNELFHHQYNLFQEPTPQAVQRELERANLPPLESNKIEWVIEKLGTPIGLAALVDLNLNNSRAELLIGFPESVSSFTTVEATLLVLEFAFSTLGLFKLYSYVYSDNITGQKNTLSLGFEQEGLLKSHVQDPYLKSRLDLYVNGCIQPDFFGNKTLMRIYIRLLGRLPKSHV
jgi:diamine N-acetyltransferase